MTKKHNDPRFDEIKETTGLDGIELQRYMLNATADQFKRVDDDAEVRREETVGTMTIASMALLIAEDLSAVSVDPKIVAAITDVVHACDKVVQLCKDEASGLKEEKQEKPS